MIIKGMAARGISPSVQESERTFCDELKFAKRGDTNAMSYLYQQCFSGVFGYIYRKTPDYQTAEDLTQEVFEKMVKRICDVKANNEVGFRAWLLKVADATMAQHYHVSKRIECVPLEETPEIPCVTEKQSTVTEAFDKLTEEQKQVLDSTILLGYSAEEVGRMMGKKADTVRRMKFRGLCTMKRILVASLLILLFLLGITVKFIYGATPASPLYRIKLLGERIAPFQQEKKPQVQPVQDQDNDILPSIAPVTPTVTSTPVSTSSAVAQPISTTPTITPTVTPEKEPVVCLARMCILP